MAVPKANDPPFATLNHFAADLGIPSESDLLRIGISRLLEAKQRQAESEAPVLCRRRGLLLLARVDGATGARGLPCARPQGTQGRQRDRNLCRRTGPGRRSWLYERPNSSYELRKTAIP